MLFTPKSWNNVHHEGAQGSAVMEWTFWSLSSDFSAFLSILEDDHDENTSLGCYGNKTHII